MSQNINDGVGYLIVRKADGLALADKLEKDDLFVRTDRREADDNDGLLARNGRDSARSGPNGQAGEIQGQY